MVVGQPWVRKRRGQWATCTCGSSFKASSVTRQAFKGGGLRKGSWQRQREWRKGEAKGLLIILVNGRAAAFLLVVAPVYIPQCSCALPIRERGMVGKLHSW